MSLSRVLRLHCITHPDERLVDFYTEVDGWWRPCARVPADVNFFDLLGHYGPGVLHESVWRSRRVVPTFTAEEVRGPLFRGTPGTAWEDNWHIPLPTGYVWNPELGAAYPADKLHGDRHIDPEAEHGQGLRVRYRARCPRTDCTAPTMTQENLLRVLRWLHEHRGKVDRHVAFLQSQGQVANWKLIQEPRYRVKADGTIESDGYAFLSADWDTLLRILPAKPDSSG